LNLRAERAGRAGQHSTLKGSGCAEPISEGAKVLAMGTSDGLMADIAQGVKQLGGTWGTVMGTMDGALAGPQFLEDGVEKLAGLAGVTNGEIRLFLGLLLAYPAAHVWRTLPNARARHLYSCIAGCSMLQFVYGAQWLHVLIASSISYAIMAFGGADTVGLNLLFVMTYLACGHIYRMLTDYLGWSTDWTLPYMVAVQKLSSLAFNYYDGMHQEKLSKEQHDLMVTSRPTLLEFFSFIFFPAAVVLGPGFEFVDYRAFSEGSITPPPAYKAGALKFAKSLGLFAIHTVITSYLPTLDLLNDEKFLTSRNVLLRWWIIFVSVFGYRIRYYFGWYIAEGAIILSGLGYNGEEEYEIRSNGSTKTARRPRWDRVEAMDIVTFELTQCVRDSANSWNKTTNLWLKRYVYERYVVSRRPGAAKC